MKTFHHTLGHVAGQTMTVAEIRKALEAYPDDMPVFCAWEGVYAYINPEGFAVNDVDKGMKSERVQCLVIDVEDY